MLTSTKIEDSDLKRLQQIAERRGTTTYKVLHDLVEWAEEDDLNEQAFDDAVRSPEVKNAFKQLDDTCERIGL